MWIAGMYDGPLLRYSVVEDGIGIYTTTPLLAGHQDLTPNSDAARLRLDSPTYTNGHLKIAELLIQRGASVDGSNDKQETPLYQARLLIDYGATVHTTDNNVWTLLHTASRRGHDLVVVKLLLRLGADVDVLNKAGRSAAELASENDQAEVAKFISEYKANANTRNKLLSTTLDTAECGADDDGKDEAKVSLHAAAEEGNTDTLKSLLERGMDINARNARNETPLHRAVVKGDIDVVRLLIERGAGVNSRHSRDKRGWTPRGLTGPSRSRADVNARER